MKGDVMMIAVAALDALSRYRALTDAESLNLERMIRAQEMSLQGSARLRAWNHTAKRACGPVESEMREAMRQHDRHIDRLARGQ